MSGDKKLIYFLVALIIFLSIILLIKIKTMPKYDPEIYADIYDEYEDVSTFRDTMNDSFLLDYLVMNEMLNNGNSKYDDGEVSKYYIRIIWYKTG